MQRHITTIMLSAAMATAISLCQSCGNSSAPSPIADDTANAYMPDEYEEQGVICMDSMTVADTVTADGITYSYTIKRVSDPDLPEIVDAESGVHYQDNRITLTLKADGRQLLHRTFTKQDFKAHLQGDFINQGRLEGFVFDKAVAEGIQFATSISYPQSDLYIPLLITVSRSGSISIQKDDLMQE